MPRLAARNMNIIGLVGMVIAKEHQKMFHRRDFKEPNFPAAAIDLSGFRCKR